MRLNLKQKLKGLFTKKNVQKLRGYGRTIGKYGRRAQKVQGELFEFPEMEGFDLFGSPKKRRSRKRKK